MRLDRQRLKSSVAGAKFKESRRLLLACVKHHYVVSEIETADVMCNRQNH